MRTRKQTVRTAKPDELDLLPREEGMKRADDLLRAMLNSPPEPYTPKPKPKRRAKKRS